MHAGEVSSGVLTAAGKAYLVVLGEHPANDIKNGVTMLYDIASQARSSNNLIPCCECRSRLFHVLQCCSRD